MCKFVSAVATKDRLFFGPGDSHSDIIDYHDINEYGVRGVNIVKLELAPNYGNTKDPIHKWKFIIDQDLLPTWWDPKVYEKKMRDAVRRSGVKDASIKYERGYGGSGTKFNKIYDAAYKKYDRVRSSANTELNNTKNTGYNKYRDGLFSFKQYVKICNAALRKYNKIINPVYEVFQKIINAAHQEKEASRNCVVNEYRETRKKIADKTW